MSTLTSPPAKHPAATDELPPLQTGDHLDQATFHRRYEATPSKFRAELVQGVVIVPSPSGCPHGEAHARVLMWAGHYSAMTPGTKCYDNTTTIIDDENEYQPDVQLVIRPDHGGQNVRLSNYVYGAPHLMIEVAASSEAYDLYEKFDVYQRAGVKEYLVVLVREREVRWFAAVEQKFELLPAEAGVIRSRFFPGLWLDTAAVFADIPAGLITTLQAGLADPAHAAFVQQLAARQQSAESPPA